MKPHRTSHAGQMLTLATVRFTAEDDVVKRRRLAAGMRAMPMLRMQGHTS